MQRWVAIVAMFVLSTGLSLTQKPEEAPPRFAPAEIVSAADAYYPVNSVAFGTVVLQVTIGPSGKPEQVRVARDIPSLTPEALRAVKKWKFRPATLDGKPVRSVIAVAFTFVSPYRSR